MKALLIEFVKLIISSVFLLTILPSEAVEDVARFANQQALDEYCRRVVDESPAEAVKFYSKIRSFYLEQEPPRNDLVLELAFWTAKNPKLPPYFEEQIRKYPVLVENVNEREHLIRALGEFPAEWAVRILSRLVLEDEIVQSNKYDIKNDEVYHAILDAAGRGPDAMANSVFATESLRHMKMHKFSEVYVDREAGEELQDFNKRAKTKKINWIIANQSRIPEIVKASWGDKAVLNAELGLGPENLPIKAGPPTGKAEASERLHREAVTIPAVSENHSSLPKWTWLWIAVSCLVGTGFWIVVRQRRLRP